MTYMYLADAEVRGPEVMRPLAETVRLVDAGEGDGREGADPGQAAPRPAAHDRLGRHEQEVDVTPLHRFDYLSQ